MSTIKMPEPHNRETSKNDIKAKRLAELDLLRERLSLMIKIQANAHQRARISDDPVQVHLERLNDYDQFMGLLVDSFEGLALTISAKQPGGAPKNVYRSKAYSLATNHYINTGRHISAKVLLQAVVGSLPEDLRYGDSNGKEVISLRLAGDVIRQFKRDLIVDIADN